MRQIAFLSWLLLFAAGARATPTLLRVSVAETVRCPRAEDLQAALAQRFGPERVAAGEVGPNELGLSMSAVADAVELALVAGPGALPTRRHLPLTDGSCADLIETVGLLVDAWVRELPWHGVGFLPEAAAAPADAGVATSPDVDAGSAALLATPAQLFATLTLGAAGGALVGGDGSNLGPEARLALDLAVYRRFGAAFFASAIENVASSQVSPGTITASRQTVAFAARYALVDDRESGLRLYAGLALQAFEAQSSGYTTVTSSFDVVPALLLSALWRQNLWGPLSAYAQLALTLGPETDFQITEGATPIVALALPPAWFDLSVGLALRLF